MNERALRILEFDKITAQLEECAVSSVGKSYAKAVTPSEDLDEVQRWQEETEEALRCLIKKGAPELFGIKNLSPETSRARMGGTLTPQGLLNIGGSLRASRGLERYGKELSENEVDAVKIIEITSLLYQNPGLEEEIDLCIENEETVRDSASNKLFSIRKKISRKNDEIRERMQKLIKNSDTKKYLQDSLVVMRDGRFCLPVKRESQGSIKGVAHDASSSGQTVFVEPIEVVKINNELRELSAEEKEEVERILSALSHKVSEVSEQIDANQELLVSLDFIFAKGKLALKMDASRPELNRKGFLNFKKARHPLINPELCVPIDVSLGRDFSTLVITGPNTGGKTVTLKTVGLLSLMVQTGLHIPVQEGSEAAVFTEIFADIGDEQSIEQSLSTFSSHLKNIVEIMTNLRVNSLVLFDELGAGTDPQEGAALAMALLDYLLKIKVRTLATTHYSQLKLYALTTEGVKNASVEFDVESLSPTYKLLIGLPGKSNAFAISERLGLKPHIIEAAKAMMDRDSISFEEVLARLDRDKKEIEAALEEARKAKEESEILRKRLEKKNEKLDLSREKELEKARDEAREIIREAREESDELLKILIKNASLIPKEDMRLVEERSRKLNEKKIQTKRAPSVSNVSPDDLEIGSSVEIIPYQTQGTVLEKPAAEGTVLVKSGIMKLNVKLSELRLIQKPSDPTKEQRGRLRQLRSQFISSELDIRGETVDSAILKLDKYLDDCYIAGLERVTIIHGKGTGALREGVREFLNKSKYVKCMEYAPMNLGGDGASIVTIINT